jgi:hypothetical protein
MREELRIVEGDEEPRRCLGVGTAQPPRTLSEPLKRGPQQGTSHPRFEILVEQNRSHILQVQLHDRTPL